AFKVPVQMTVEASTTVQIPTLAAQVPGSARSCGGSVAVKLVAFGGGPGLVICAVTATTAPGPVQTAGSVREIPIEGLTVWEGTVLPMLVEGALPLPAASVALPAAMLAITAPSAVIPVTATLYVAPPPVMTAVVAPAAPPNVTSPVVKPVTGSLKTTVK